MPHFRMISARMSRVAKGVLTVCALTVAGAALSACGTEHLSAPGGNQEGAPTAQASP